MTSIINQLLAAGTKRIFVCDISHVFPPPALAYLVDSNALCDVWNAALPGFLAQFGSRVVIVTGLAAATQADMFPTTGTHPNRRFDNQIGILIADAMDPYIEPVPQGPFPRRVSRGDPAQKSIQTLLYTDGATMPYLSGLKPPGAASFAVFGDFFPTALSSGTFNIWQYGDSAATGVALQTNGATLQVVLQGVTIIAAIPLQIAEWHRLCLWADATTGWVSLAVNGVVVAAVQPAAWNITVQQTTYWGYVTPAAQNGAEGLYDRWSVYQGTELATFSEMVKNIEDEFWEYTRPPGLTAEVLMDATGVPTEVITGTLGALVGTATNAQPDIYPKWCDQENWRPPNALICHEVGGFADTAFYEAAAPLGLTAAAGTLHVIIRRTSDKNAAFDDLVGSENFPWTVGGHIGFIVGATTDTYALNALGIAAQPVAVVEKATAINNLVVVSQIFGAVAPLYINGVVGGTVGNTTGYSEVGAKASVGTRATSHTDSCKGANIIGFAVSTASATAAEVQALISDVARLGPEQALKNLHMANISVWLAKDAAATWAPAIGAGPTFTRTGSPYVTPFTAPVYGRPALL